MKCADFASPFCPCELAEHGQCLVCAQCSGKEMCDCGDTTGYCVMQELHNNGGKAMSLRPTYECKVTTTRKVGDDAVLIRVSGQDIDTRDFQQMGSFAFVRTNRNVYYDTPISVLYSEHDVNSLGFVIITKGIKTSCFAKVKVGDTVWIRGPYYNGLFNKGYVSTLKNSQALLLTRGIGVLPTLHVTGGLLRNNNHIKLLVDPGTFNTDFIKTLCDFYELEITPCSITDTQGELTEEMKQLLSKLSPENCRLLHLGLSDYLIGKVVNFLIDGNGYLPELSACNNAKICCGEGICGACTVNANARDVIHLCKAQIDVYKHFRKY